MLASNCKLHISRGIPSHCRLISQLSHRDMEGMIGGIITSTRPPSSQLQFKSVWRFTAVFLLQPKLTIFQRRAGHLQQYLCRVFFLRDLGTFPVILSATKKKLGNFNRNPDVFLTPTKQFLCLNLSGP